VGAILALPKTYASNYYSGFKILGDDAYIQNSDKKLGNKKIE